MAFVGLVFQICGADSLIINEIHFNPDVKTEPAEFVELFNAGSTTVNLAGWRFTGGLDFLFPATNVAPNGYVVVAQNPAFLLTKYGAAGALGPFNADGSSGLSKYGSKLNLRNPAGEIADQVEYQVGFPWPTVGDPPGYSIELINPGLDNNLGGSWRASVASNGTQTSQLLIQTNSTWKYFKGASEASTPATAWRAAGFDDSSWLSGPAPIGYEPTNGIPMATPLPDMDGNYSSVFFRRKFVVDTSLAVTSLLLEALYDDGFKVWINGSNVLNANISTGELPYNGVAGSARESVAYDLFTLNSANSYLVNGTNIIAIQAHNSALSGSTDFYLDVRLRAQTGASGRGPTPGKANSVFAPNAPPQVRQVEHNPEQPPGGQVVTVTAKVTDPDGVASVTLQYQVVSPGNYIELSDPAYANVVNWISIPMNDAGADGDVTPGDDVFTAQIPASVQTHRRLIRYRMIVADSLGNTVRVPYADDPQPNFAYFVYNAVPAWSGAVQPGAAGTNGVVITVGSNEMNRLPVYHLIAKSNSVAVATGWAPGQPNNQYGGDNYLWTGAMVYDGKVYDHIQFRMRGGVWRYSMGKNAWKFAFNRGHDFQARDDWGNKYSSVWRRLSFRPDIQQGDYLHRGEQGLFESVGYKLFRLAGVNAPKTTHVQFRIIDDARESVPGNQYGGDFWGLYLVVEEQDGRFLEERGLPDGNIYDMESGTGILNHTGARGPIDKSDLNGFLNTYNSVTNGSLPDLWWRTNLNLTTYYDYQAILQGIHQYDIADGKNYFYYLNPVTRQWDVWPWDLDLTWADNMYRAGQQGGDEPFKSRVLNNFANPGARPGLSTEFRNRVREIRDLLFNTDQAYLVLDEMAALIHGPTNQYSITDADRGQWDYNPIMLNSAIVNLSKAGNYHFYQWQNEPGTSNNFFGAVQLMKNYVRYRSTNAAFSLDTISTEPNRPKRPGLTYTGPTNFPINRLTFRSTNYSGTTAFASMRWRLGEVTDPASPNYRPDQPHKYEIETVWDSGPIAVFNPDITIPANVPRAGSRYRVRVQHTDVNGRNSNWSPPIEFTCGEPENVGDLLNFLRITEVMYNPLPGGYEFVELHNLSPTVTLDLAGVKFTQGIDYTCLAGAALPPGGYLLVIGTTNIAAFRAYYGLDDSVAILAAFTGSLNNGGEQLTLRTAAGGTDIVSFNYGDGRGWPPAADGAGHSLVLLDSAESGQDAGAGEYGGNWRASTYLKGSPGRTDAVPPSGPVLNEIVAHTDFTAEFDSNDWIELYNPTAAAITFGPGWYLSDDGTNLTKWQIPATNVIRAQGWLTFDEVTGFHNPTNIGFGLDKGGEQVFLSYLPGTSGDRVVDCVSFKGQENEWSLGRYPDGGALWYALNPRTRDAANAAPPLHLVISEVLYHPPDIGGTNDDSLNEFIELHNPTAAPVALFNTNGTWRLSGGVDFAFPTNLTLGVNEYILAVNFSPVTNTAQLASFKALYGITNSALRIFGPYAGKLANNSDRVALERPQHPEATNQPVSWVIVDEVIYADQPPWPCGSDGTGNSLQRLNLAGHGSDPANWAAEFPTAGQPRAMLPAGLAVIINQPQSRATPTNSNVSFSVSVCGTPPFSYQWSFNGTSITGATNATLNLINVSLSDAGDYMVIISNSAGSIPSQPATLYVQTSPSILAQPQPVTVVRDQTAMFSVTAGGSAPIQYQWRFNGANLGGATNSLLIFTNAQASQAGTYGVLVFNSAGSIPSSNALLTVDIPATITNQPVSQAVTNNVNVTFSVGAIGTGALVYQWQLNGTNLPAAINPALVITNAQLVHAGTYTAIVTNQFGSVTSQPAVLTVLVRPVFTRQPQDVVVLAGQDAAFTVAVDGTPPFGFRWRRDTTNYLNLGVASNSIVITNVTLAMNSNKFQAIVTNIVVPGGVISSSAFLYVLAGGDDTDGDGMTNLQEFLAGTDPRNPASYLKIDSLDLLSTTNNLLRIRFAAVSNRTYTVFQRDGLTPQPWTRWLDIDAVPTNRVLQLTNQPPAATPQRYFRLQTPRVP